MKFFKRRGRVLDLTKRYEKQQEQAEEMKQEMQEESSDSGGLGFFGAIGQTVSSQPSEDEGYVDVSVGAEEKKRKLAKRLMEMTNKIEDLSNQIYHLQQRIEVLERKGGVGY